MFKFCQGSPPSFDFFPAETCGMTQAIRRNLDRSKEPVVIMSSSCGFKISGSSSVSFDQYVFSIRICQSLGVGLCYLCDRGGSSTPVDPTYIERGSNSKEINLESSTENGLTAWTWVHPFSNLEQLLYWKRKVDCDGGLRSALRTRLALSCGMVTGWFPHPLQGSPRCSSLWAGRNPCLAGMASHTLAMSQAPNPPKMGKVDKGGTCESFVFSHLALSLVLYL